MADASLKPLMNAIANVGGGKHWWIQLVLDLAFLQLQQQADLSGAEVSAADVFEAVTANFNGEIIKHVRLRRNGTAA
jgi:hypothetical protein